MLWMSIGFAVGLVVSLLFVLRECFFRVDEGHLAVVTRFGRALRREDGALRTWGPGIHFKAPFDRTHTESTKERTLELSGEAAGTTAMCRDGTVLRFDSNLRYQVGESGLERWLFDLERPIEHATGVFTCALRGEIAGYGGTDDETAGTYAAIQRERKHLNDSLAEFVRERSQRLYGVEFHAVDLVDILPPDELRAALNAVIHAGADADRNFALAEAGCIRRVLAARHGVEVSRKRAEATEIELGELGGFLNELQRGGTLDAYVTHRRAEIVSQARTVFLRSAP